MVLKKITGVKTSKYYNFDKTIKITRFVISNHATAFENHSILQNHSMFNTQK
jgi:hypothetical protein